MKCLRLALYAFSWIFWAAACTSEAPAPEPPTEPAPTTVAPTPTLPPPTAQAADTATIDSSLLVQKVERPSRRPPELSFAKTTHTYDTIDQGAVIEHEFTFTNTGERPLTIRDVKGSCGCTIGSYPFLDIAPGEQSSIKARFDSKGKQGPQFTTITVYSNAEGEDQVLSLKGVVRGADGSVGPNTVAH